MKIKTKQIIIVVLAAVIIFSVSYVYLARDKKTIEVLKSETTNETQEINDDNDDKEEVPAPPEVEFVYVYVCGEVKQSGVYKLPFGSRVIDAVDMAGGLTSDANETAINLAEIVNDEQQVYIPKIGEEIENMPNNNENNKNSDLSRININTASLNELKTLDGIGDKIGHNIIDYRETNGAFEKIEDLKKVSKIGDKIFDNIKDKITVD